MTIFSLERSRRIHSRELEVKSLLQINFDHRDWLFDGCVNEKAVLDEGCRDLFTPPVPQAAEHHRIHSFNHQPTSLQRTYPHPHPKIPA
jgi:hypothetical protein